MTTGSPAERDRIKHPELFSEIITRDAELLSIMRYIEVVAGSSQPILVTGETGVGKELIARAIHNVSGRKGRFIVVNVAGLDDHIFSDTLFGHVKGAFTGADRMRAGMVELAADGTLVLDEIGDISPLSQLKLLRLLEQAEYQPLGRDDTVYSHAAIVSVTNQDLWALQKEGRFRKDLNFRLRTHHINVPPLRERTDDILMLANHFLRLASELFGKKNMRMENACFNIMKSYPFPGNIRELKAIVFDAVSRETSRMLTAETLKRCMAKRESDNGLKRDTASNGTGEIVFPERLPTIKECTKTLIGEAMKRADGNQSRAAKMLGISQPALSKRLKNWKN